MIRGAIPLLHVSNAAAAESFYCGLLGFELEFAHRPQGVEADPCYMGLSRDGIWIHLSSFSGDGVAGGVVNLLVEDVDALHGEFAAKGVAIDMPPVDQSWGNREMYVKDADRNSLRFLQVPEKA
ncbi:Glyoxalase [Candidatus Sulfotelmatomonas gaucii]|uniref:Bleomycin resistance protein n=1 Tax=Candidatus Sulfuritelmatomonas gaucii TaxID=2043161 RepID=A0A2N9LM32_9BACT|nr:Glyoxalase [Candidatus Sulfotelmatomonas gaucii]